MSFIVDTFRKLKTNGKKFTTLTDHVVEVGNGLVNGDPELVESCFIEYGLKPLANLFLESPDKCTCLLYTSPSPRDS